MLNFNVDVSFHLYFVVFYSLSSKHDGISILGSGTEPLDLHTVS